MGSYRRSRLRLTILSKTWWFAFLAHVNVKNVKSFPGHKAHWAALISVSLAISQAPVYTARREASASRGVAIYVQFSLILVALSTVGWPGWVDLLVYISVCADGVPLDRNTSDMTVTLRSREEIHLPSAVYWDIHANGLNRRTVAYMIYCFRYWWNSLEWLYLNVHMHFDSCYQIPTKMWIPDVPESTTLPPTRTIWPPWLRDVSFFVTGLQHNSSMLCRWSVLAIAKVSVCPSVCLSVTFCNPVKTV